MREKPILFSAPMVRAILSGSKSQTRRICNPQPVSVGSLGKRRVYRDEEFKRAWETIKGTGECDQDRDCPYGKPGERLWVKESWRTGARLDAKSPKVIELACRDAGYTHGACCPVRYEADGSYTAWGDRDAADFGMWGKHRVSIHMPRWASRLTLEITGVRVERLQDISRTDAIAEGLDHVSDGGSPWGIVGLAPSWSGDPRKSYRALWESINGPGSWDANPWVWVVEFRRIP